MQVFEKKTLFQYRTRSTPVAMAQAPARLGVFIAPQLSGSAQILGSGRARAAFESQEDAR